jgi:hypothetical protein
MEGDAAADPVSWSLDQLRTRLPEMVCRAGGNPEAAADCDSLAARDAISVIAQKLGRA